MEKITVADVEVLIEGEGPQTIVMLHGWPDTHRLWEPQVAFLKPHFRCVRFSLPGFELNAKRQCYDLDAVLEKVSAIVDAVSPDKEVNLLLHDWGCFYGYQYYLRHPQRVQRIIGVDIGDAGSKHHELSLAAKLMLFSYQMWLAASWLIGGRIGDGMARLIARLSKAPAPLETIHSGMSYPYYWKWSHTFSGKPLGNLPLRINCPMMFMYGKSKPGMFHSQQWADRIQAMPGSKVMAFDTQHWVMEDEHGFNQAVYQWLTQPLPKN